MSTQDKIAAGAPLAHGVAESQMGNAQSQPAAPVSGLVERLDAHKTRIWNNEHELNIVRMLLAEAAQALRDAEALGRYETINAEFMRGQKLGREAAERDLSSTRQRLAELLLAAIQMSDALHNEELQGAELKASTDTAWEKLSVFIESNRAARNRVALDEMIAAEPHKPHASPDGRLYYIPNEVKP